MAVKLPKETRTKIVAAMRAWFAEKRDDELGKLEAQLLLDFLLERIGPAVYNQAVRDAQAAMQDKLVDLDGELYEEEPPAEADAAKG